VRTADFDFTLPPELIAQHPAPRRDASRLLVLHRSHGKIEHRQFPDLLDFLQSGDVLVLNNSRVIPARLHGVNMHTGGRFEILLVEERATNDWRVLLRPAKRARPGTEIQLEVPNRTNGKIRNLKATVLEKISEGQCRLQFGGVSDLKDILDELGEIPLPPYIHRDHQFPEDKERYQTVYAQIAGSVAAPTAGLHFTPGLLEQIRGRGVQICFVTLHVGLGTFLPVKTESLEAHKMHEERFEIDDETARRVHEAKKNGRRVIAVGTTSVRVLESVAAQNGGKIAKTSTKTAIFIHPPFQFQMVDALLTNFHLPCSTLLMLVSAFAAPAPANATTGRDLVLRAYAEAIRERYRFFSYGDAMLIL
jgi:S-adenosylmethionine:tRNA ribosyltransferase-isomerase